MVAAPLEREGLDAALGGLAMPRRPVKDLHDALLAHGVQEKLLDLVGGQTGGRIGRLFQGSLQGGSRG